jgi:hypothetical protein
MHWLVVAIPVAIFSVLAILLSLGARERKVAEVEFRHIAALSETDAKMLALQLLERPGLFSTKPAEGPLAAFELPSSVSELLEMYDEIVKGEFWVGRSALTQVPRVPGYTKIGEDFEFEQMLVRSGDQRIYSSYEESPSTSPMEFMPTLWHKIVAISNVLMPIMRNGV